VAEGVSSAEIHRRLAAVFKVTEFHAHVMYISVGAHFCDGHQSVSDSVHIGMLRTAMTADNINRVLEIDA